ncbi:MAG TPA: XrtA system polysaccharide deacetylase [Gemmatimonadaceae bacterium]|jgi:polysaccharide deacetylase family protein (PEP-CTERM system associated)
MSTAHIFTVDVEEYFQVHAFEGVIRRTEWQDLPSRVARNVDSVLELLSEHGASATFFILGWVADRHPHVVRRIAEAGHEVASHGWWHYRVTSLEPEEFREDIRASKSLLEDICGRPVTGYRAPSFSITPDSQFALDVLLEEGYVYDSSIFPIRRSNYGWPGAPPIPHLLHCASGTLIEFPLATSLWGSFRIPAAGGGYFRQFPYSIVQRAFREHDTQGVPGVFYIHPWELDAEQPRVRVGPLSQLRHYRGLKGTQARLDRLLREFRFTSIAARLAEGHSRLQIESPTSSFAS